MLAAAGAPLPTKKIDGLNFLPLLTNQTKKGPWEVFYYYFDGNTLQAVRYKHWKLVLPHHTGSYALTVHGKEGTPGQKTPVDVTQALYDLAHDPGEAYDAQTLYPEVVQQIQQLATQARQELGDDLTHQQGSGVRPPVRYE